MAYIFTFIQNCTAFLSSSLALPSIIRCSLSILFLASVSSSKLHFSHLFKFSFIPPSLPLLAVLSFVHPFIIVSISCLLSFQPLLFPFSFLFQFFIYSSTNLSSPFPFPVYLSFSLLLPFPLLPLNCSLSPSLPFFHLPVILSFIPSSTFPFLISQWFFSLSSSFPSSPSLSFISSLPFPFHTS